MKALYVIQEKQRQFFSNSPEAADRTAPFVGVEEVAVDLGWADIDALTACQGLEQLNLALETGSSRGAYDPRQDPLPGQRVFETTTLAARLVALAFSSSS